MAQKQSRVSQGGNVVGGGGGASVDPTEQSGMALGGQTDRFRNAATNVQGVLLKGVLRASRSLGLKP